MVFEGHDLSAVQARLQKYSDQLKDCFAKLPSHRKLYNISDQNNLACRMRKKVSRMRISLRSRMTGVQTLHTCLLSIIFIVKDHPADQHLT